VGIHLIGNSFDFSSSISLGAERWVKLTPHKNAENAISNLKENEYSIVVLQPKDFKLPAGSEKAFSVSQLPFEKKLALIFGNETDGVDPLFVQAADYFAYIPMFGFVESLNISVACAVTLFCSTIAESKPIQRSAPIADKQKSALRENWLRRNVRNSDIILREIEIRKTFEN
jgi:tRNA(Leu) C34 or U34 (ribose-2'-O)-methylase TrmL